MRPLHRSTQPPGTSSSTLAIEVWQSFGRGLLEASPLAELRCCFEGCIERTAVDARVIQIAIIRLAQREQGGLLFAIGDGRGNPAVEKAPQARDQEEGPSP